MSMNVNNNPTINVGDLQSMTLQQIAQNRAPSAAPKNDFKHSIFFKIITLGIGAAVVAAQDAKQARQARQEAAVLREATFATAVQIFTRLNTLLSPNANLREDRLRDEIPLSPWAVNNGKAERDTERPLHLKMGDDGTLHVKQWNEDEFKPMNVGVKELREKLANEIFSNPDLFSPADYLAALESIVVDSNDDIDTGDSFQRRCYEQVLERWGGIGADQLINLTTANLRDLASHLYDEIGKTAGGANSAVLTGETFADFNSRLESNDLNPQIDPDAMINDFEIVEHCADHIKGQLEVMNQQIEARRLESEDAAVLIEALRKEPNADTKIVMNPQVQGANAPHEPTQRERLQPIRDLAADLIQTQDPVTHDQNLAVGKQKLNSPEKIVAQALVRHAETLAKLLLDQDGTMDGLDDYTAQFLKIFLNGPGDEMELLDFAKPQGIATTLGLQDFKLMSVDDLAASIRNKADVLTKDGKYNTIDLIKQRFELTKLSTMLSKVATYALNEMQDGIVEEMDAAFKNVKGGKSIENQNIDEMYDDATKPKDGSYTAFVKEVLGQYFGALTGKDNGKYKDLSDGLEEDRRNMFAAMMRYAPNDGKDKAGYFAAAVKGAGPLMQKILQGLDANMLGDNALAGALKDMKKNLAPLPEEYVKAQLLDIVNRSNGSISRIERVKTLGCASIAQAILCHVHGPEMPPEGKMVVVKLQRPNALTNLNREKELILRMAENVKMRTTYEGMINTIMEEFDFIGEENNIKAGEVYDSGFPRVKAVKADPLVPTTPTSLVMECAPGETVSDELEVAKTKIRELNELLVDENLSDEDRTRHIAEFQELHDKLVKYQKDLSDLSTKWVTEGLFGSGMFHGDLHGGNIMVSEKDGVTLIDFGNMTRLTEREQCAITKMAAAASIGNTKDKNVKVCAKAFLDGLKTLLGPTQREFLNTKAAHDSAMDMLGYIFKAGDWQDAGKRIFVALTKLQELGIEIPPQIFKFSQSQMRLQSAVDNVTNLVKDATSAIRKLTSTPGIAKPIFYTMGLFDAEEGIDLIATLQDPQQLSRSAANVLHSTIHKRCKQLRELMTLLSTEDPTGVRDPDDGPFDASELDADLQRDLQIQRRAVIQIFKKPIDLTLDNQSNDAKFWKKAVVDKIKALNDPKLTAAYEDYCSFVSNGNQTSNDVDGKICAAPPEVVRVAEAYIEAELAAIERHAKDLTKMKPSEDDKLKTFCQSMGTAIKQNLKAAMKRIGLDLYKAAV